MTSFVPTDEQKAILDFKSHMVITACPGSGKTAVISEKVRQILPTIPSYRGIIAISYTKKASAELKRRCELDGLETKKSFFGTIDAFSISEIIVPFFRHLCTKNIEKIEIKYFDSLTEENKAIFSDITIKALTTEQTSLIIDKLVTLYQNGIVLMETVGILAVHVVQNSKACKRYLKARYSAIFIDEYQDSGEPQHKLFACFKDLDIVSVAVGDENQSIFGFSHRSPQFLRSLCIENSGYKHLELKINHRCHPSIVNYANRLLDHNCTLQATQVINVFRKNVTGTQIEVTLWINSILEQIKSRFNIQYNREIGILVRNSGTGKIVKNELTTPSRFFSDNDLTSSTSQCSKIFCALISFRMDSRLTAQSIIDEFVLRNIKRSELVNLRNKIISCRSCSFSDLEKNLISTVEMIRNAVVSDSSILELNAVLGEPNKMKIFDPISDDEIQILTLHKAKGLEFKVVFHLDLYDWILPTRSFKEGSYDVVFENEQECLNLHYVGITRAQVACFLVTSTKRFNSLNQKKNAQPSQFYAKPGISGLFLSAWCENQ